MNVSYRNIKQSGSTKNSNIDFLFYSKLVEFTPEEGTF